MADGSTMPINARINQKGQSEKGRDTAKIAGGTAAGAIIGHQINDGSGRGHRRHRRRCGGSHRREEDRHRSRDPGGQRAAGQRAQRVVYSGR